MTEDEKHFNAEKIFLWLLVLTVLEVGYGFAGARFDWNRLPLWSGLGFFAFFKGWLIAVYFMHLRFEGWVVKSLMLPTPLLILVIYGFISPDISRSKVLDHPIGAQYDSTTGAIVRDMGVSDAAHAEDEEEEQEQEE